MVSKSCWRIAKAPVAKAPVAKAPVAKAPVVKALVAKAPVVKALVAKAPVGQVPVGLWSEDLSLSDLCSLSTNHHNKLRVFNFSFFTCKFDVTNVKNSSSDFQDGFSFSFSSFSSVLNDFQGVLGHH